MKPECFFIIPKDKKRWLGDLKTYVKQSEEKNFRKTFFKKTISAQQHGKNILVEKYGMAPVGKDLRVNSTTMNADILEVNWNPQKIVPNLYEETTSDFNEDTLTVNKNSFKDFFDGGYIF